MEFKEITGGPLHCYETPHLIRSGLIDTEEKAAALMREGRLVSIQVNDPVTEWELIQQQHEALQNTAHLIIPIERCYVEKKPFIPAGRLEMIHNLTRYLNSEGWLHYCRWFLEEVVRAKKLIKLESANEYTLEARLDDYRHDVDSSILRGVEKEIYEVSQKRGKARNEKELIACEKELIRLGMELTEIIDGIGKLLSNIAAAIEAVQNEEFSDIKAMCRIFARLIKGQESVSQLRDLAVFNQLLGVEAIVSCDTGLERTSLAFSILKASELLLASGQEESHWSALVREVFDASPLFSIDPAKKLSSQWSILAK